MQTYKYTRQENAINLLSIFQNKESKFKNGVSIMKQDKRELLAHYLIE